MTRRKQRRAYFYRYKRVFSIGTLAITTYNPNTLEITNQWLYEDFLSVKPWKSASNDLKQEEYKIHVKNRGKRDEMRFSSEYTTDILTHCLQFSTKFAERNTDPLVIIQVGGILQHCLTDCNCLQTKLERKQNPD